MALIDDPPTASPGNSSPLDGRTKWVAGAGAAVLVVALVGLGLSAVGRGSGVGPVLAIAIAALGGAVLASSLIAEQP